MSTVMPVENKGDFELTPAGSHLAICYRVIDLGTQQKTYQGEISHKPTILLGFELCHEAMTDGRPFSAQQRFVLSSHKKSKLRAFLEAWRGVPFTDAEFGKFDVANLIGKPCLLGIVHAIQPDATYANINSVMRITKGMEVPPMKNEALHFTFDNFNQEVFNKLSEGLQAVIAKSPEYQSLKGGKALEESLPESNGMHAVPEDEIPF